MRRVVLFGALTVALLMAAPLAAQAAGTSSGMPTHSRTMVQKKHAAASAPTHRVQRHAWTKKRMPSHHRTTQGNAPTRHSRQAT